ncbi:MAG TPA: SgcJ/EcaC family oxidoreductase [Gemmatimonadaceae bacterium]|nr:SgcJ/EcaC family oxidoreductase [Gemmatimonadaceae bacterium]
MRVGGLLILVFAVTACSKTDTPAADTSGATATATAPANDDAAKDAIGKIRSEWMAAANRKDSAAVAAYYADDATFVGTETPLAEGRAAIHSAFSRSFPVTTLESIDSKELTVSGDVAYDYGTFRQVVTMPNAQPQTINGHYLVALKRQGDGSWKITRHVATTPPVQR